MHDLWPLTSTEHFLKNPNKNKYHLKDIKQNFLKKIIFNKKKNYLAKKISF